jgi:pimeloyl-ACP methyl ester carboxylesterase
MRRHEALLNQINEYRGNYDMNKLTRRNGIHLLLIAALFLGVITLTSLGAIMNTANAQDSKPTVVLVHGAFAESSSWNGVLTELIAKGYPTVAVANPLRGVKSDANYVASVLTDIKGSIVLVGHSYGGSVITEAVNGNKNVKALVYVAGFAPDTGETAAKLSGRYPGGTLGPTLAPPVALPDGGKDLYIQQDKFQAQFAADVPVADAKLMASTQRPIAEAALNEASGAPAWKSTPSWFIYGDRDLNIPAAAHAFMAKRANSKETIAVKGASHVVMISHPDAVAKLIEQAAAAN